MCTTALKSIGSEVKDCKIRVAKPRKYGSVASLDSSTLSGVGHIIGVSSCKGNGLMLNIFLVSAVLMQVVWARVQ